MEKTKPVENSAKIEQKKKTRKRTLFTVHTFNFARKTKRRTLEALKTLGYQKPEKNTCT